MRMLEYFGYSIRSLRQQRTRTSLTLLGMMIGIAVIVAMISIGKGMQVSTNQQLEKMGGDKIFVFPGGFAGGLGAPTEFVPFNDDAAQEVEKIPGVEEVFPVLVKTATVEYRGEEKSISIRGISKRGGEVMFRSFFILERGRIFEHEDDAVLGYRVSKDAFEREIGIGDTLNINNKRFKVVGIFEESGERNRDSLIFMPMEAAQTLFATKDEITSMFIVAENERVVERIAKQTEELLKKMRGGKDFDVSTTKQLAEQIARITGIITFVLGGIASVSILVGGVIIMNTMLMNVIERTREIGITKATGATSGLVLRLFLAESILVGLAGGSLGVIFGIALSKAIEAVGRAYIGAAFITVITPQMVLGAILFSIVVGGVSGAYPAYKAAKLDPVVALHYE